MNLKSIIKYFFIPTTRYDICLDYCPNNTELILIEIQKYCKKEKLQYELVEATPHPIVKINNVLCKCSVLSGGRAANYIISCKEI